MKVRLIGIVLIVIGAFLLPMMASAQDAFNQMADFFKRKLVEATSG